jgi:thymidylate synthase (FAD)
MLEEGSTPQEARSVLPNSLKTELVMTGNLRNWRHFLKLRCSKAAHTDMQVIAKMILKELKAYLPVIFEDINDN